MTDTVLRKTVYLKATKEQVWSYLTPKSWLSGFTSLNAY